MEAKPWQGAMIPKFTHLVWLRHFIGQLERGLNLLQFAQSHLIWGEGFPAPPGAESEAPACTMVLMLDCENPPSEAMCP